MAWLGTVLAPPAIAGGVWQHFVSQHVFAALAIGVAYEIVVAAVGFFAVIARGVSSRWQQRLVESLDLALRRKFSGFEDRYREFLLAGLRFIDLKGLATIGPFTPELDEVFVDVSLVSRSPHLIQPGVLSELAGPGRRALSEFIGRRQATVLAVVGAPGSGKTTLLRHTARHAYVHTKSKRKTARDIPILLYLRDHSADIVKNSSVSLPTLARKSIGTLAQDEPQGWFERQLRNGRCLVLLDGFDEVARQSDRAKVAEWVARQVQYYPENDFVISSRPHGYETAPVTGAEVLQVCGFTAAQTERFIRGWYQAIERHSTGVEGVDIEARARSEADDLLRRLEQAPALHDLTVNPLLLTMIANVHRYRGALPGNRAELYSEICQVMLWRRQDAKNLASQMNGDKKEAVLRTLAYTMMDGRVPDVSRDGLLAAFGPVLRRQSRRVTADDFLADVVTSGLLIERETEQFAFAHHTFQEYLAAAHIRENGLVGVLAGAVSDPWWRETTLLYCARSDADPIISACLSTNNITALSLAFECVDQDSAFDPTLHAQLDDILKSAYDLGGDPERRRLMAGVLLTRHLREQVRTPTGHRLCVEPITRGIYDLFLTETGTPPPDAKRVDGPADEPIAGIRGSDALAFVDWANTMTGGTSTYRLPMEASLSYRLERQTKATSGTGKHMRSTWVDGSNRKTSKAPYLWVPKGMRHPQQGDKAALHAAIRNDIIASIPSETLDLIGSGLVLMPTVINNIRSPGQESDQDLALARLPGYDQLLENTRKRVTSFAGTLKNATKESPQFNSNFSADIGLALCVVLTRRLSRAEQSARSLLHDLSPQISGATVRDLVTALGQARALMIDLIALFAHDRPTFEQAGRIDLYKIPISLLNSAISASRDANSAEDFPQAWAMELAWGADVDESNWDMLIDPDGLAANLTDAVEGLPSELETTNKESPASWLQRIAYELRVNAEPVFTRNAPTTPQISASIRLSALMLACELHELSREATWKQSHSGTAFDSEVGKMLRNVAAGITWLESRHNGTAQAAETIMLAIE